MALKKLAPTPLHAVQPRQHARDLLGLQQQLGDPDPRQRRLAARDLGAYPQSALNLGQALAAETDTSVREAVRKRQLLLELHPGSPAAQGVVQIATRLLSRA